MRYCLCIKENDKNLLHIVSHKDFKRMAKADFMRVATVEDEEAAFEKTADLVRNFRKIFWEKNKTPDFRYFKSWLTKGAIHK